MGFRSLGVLALVAALPAHGQAAAQLGAGQAQAIVQGCVDHASARGQRHAIVVVDSGGHPVASLRMGNARWGMMAFAEEKARAASAWGFATSNMEQGARQTPGFADAPAVVTVAGGVPIYDAEGQVLLGGAGASGGAPADDEACATAGVEAAGLRTTRAD